MVRHLFTYIINPNNWAPFLGIRGKLLVAFVGLAIIPIGVMGWWGTMLAGEELVESTTKHLTQELLTSVAHSENYLENIGAETRMFSHLLATDRILLKAEPKDDDAAARVHDLIQSLARLRSDFYQVRVIAANGDEIIRVERDRDAAKLIDLGELQNKYDRYYFKEAMALPSGQTYFSPIDLNQERGEIEWPHRLVFRVAHQILGDNGTVQGLVIFNVFASALLDRIMLLQPDASTNVMLVGESGDCLRRYCSGNTCRYKLSELGARNSILSPAIGKEILSGQTAVMKRVNDNFVSFAPIDVGGDGSHWSLAIIYPAEFVLGAVDAMQSKLVMYGLAMTLLALGLAVLASRGITLPIQKIHGFVQAVARGDYHQSLVVETRDEIEELALNVRTMADNIETSQRQIEGWNDSLKEEVEHKVDEVKQLIDAKRKMQSQLQHADRLASLGMLSASLAHEVGNPLASIKTAMQVHLKAESLSVSTDRIMRSVLGEIDRLAQILGRITGYVRPIKGESTAVTVGEVYLRVVFLVESEAKRRKIQLSLDGDAINARVEVIGMHLEQVLMNLVVNALQALEEHGTIVVSAWWQDEELVISVKDDGPGIPDEMQSSVFEPFITSKQDGTGLGLSIVRKLVKDLGG
ncbi:MAG: hypothetical protein CMM74_10655, partial [Rhodospirillaceae bacterium]|nr:hypothetical protein [Rhodospirillaceae bacterium]